MDPYHLGEECGEEEDYDDVSTDSMADCPTKGSSRYRKVFRNYIHVVFNKSRATEGMAFESFRASVAAIENSRDWARGAESGKEEVDRQSLFMHVICNQFADATNLDCPPPWESRPDMLAYYASGRLPRRRRRRNEEQQQAPQQQAPQKRRFIGLNEDEYNDVSRALTINDICEIRGIHRVPRMVNRVNELVALKYFNKYQKVPARNKRNVNVFEKKDEALVVEVIKDVALELVLSMLSVDDPRFTDKGTVSVAPVSAAPSVPPTTTPPAPLRANNNNNSTNGNHQARKYNYYTPTGEDLALNEPEDKRVYWRDVCRAAGVEDLAFTDQGEQFMRNRTGNNTGDFIQEISKECGRLHIRKYGLPVPNAENNRIYTRSMLQTMFTALNDVLHELGFRKR